MHSCKSASKPVIMTSPMHYNALWMFACCIIDVVSSTKAEKVINNQCGINKKTNIALLKTGCQ